MSKPKKLNGGQPVQLPSVTREAMPDYAVWQDALKGSGWRSLALAVILYRGILEIVAIGGLLVLCVIATRFIENKGNLSTRALLGALTISGMVLALCLVSLTMAARSMHATNAEQSEGGAPESGDRQGNSRQDGSAEGRNRLAQSDGRGQPSARGLRLPLETKENRG